jgi:hypothetical protein
MTIITAPNVYNVVDAPIGVPYRFGLESVVDFGGTDNDLVGVTWISENCPVTGVTNTVCLDPEAVVLDFGLQQCATPQFKPFTVYLPLDGSMAGPDDTDRARRMFSLAEQYGMERAFSAALADSVTEVAVGATASATEKLMLALAYVEQAVLEGSVAEPTIHMSRFAASVLASQLVASGTGLRTMLGSKVAAYGGWIDGYPATDSIFATGPIKGVRGPIDTFSVPNHTINSNSIVASRTYVLGYDCAAVGASVTL